MVHVLHVVNLNRATGEKSNGTHRVAPLEGNPTAGGSSGDGRRLSLVALRSGAA